MIGHGVLVSKSMTLTYVSLLLLLSFAGCGKERVPSVSPAKPDYVSLNSTAWYIMYSGGMPQHPFPAQDAAWSMPLPTAPGSVHYVQTPFQSSFAPKMITITFRLNSSQDAAYNGLVDPDAGDPATFHLFLERQGDDLTKECYRWWSKDGGYTLGSEDNSVVTIQVPLTSDRWTDVDGNHNEEEFNRTLNNLAWVGMTFGGRRYWGHGVNMAFGSADFVLLDFRLE